MKVAHGELKAPRVNSPGANFREFRAVVVIGPTASGKTSFAHATADWLAANGQPCILVNLDAFQFYRGVTAGTAKPSREEQLRYSYEGVDILEAHERFDAQSFASFASKACLAAWAKGNLPVCVGGSGLYLRAFLHGLDELPGRDEALRTFLRTCAAAWGWPALHAWLTVIDPNRASKLHPNDKTRIERALELYLLTGKQVSELYTQSEGLSEQKRLFDAFVVQVDASDEKLQAAIGTRTQLLLEAGWAQEVRGLLDIHGDALKGFQSMQAIGYPEVLEWVGSDGGAQEGKTLGLSLAQKIATLTWQYARRQRTWNAKEACDVRQRADDPQSTLDAQKAIEGWLGRARK